MFNGFKMSSIRCKSHVQEINLSKKMFSYPLKLILGFFGLFYVFGIKPKYSHTIMYECQKSPLTQCYHFYLDLFLFKLKIWHVNA